MKSDGAHEGLLTEASMHRAMGGPHDNSRLSMPELREWILAAPDGKPETYNDAARILAKAFLELLERWPERAADDLVGLCKAPPLVVAHAAARVRHPSSFMVGWAWNAARAVLGYSAAPNPALLGPFFLAIPLFGETL